MSFKLTKSAINNYITCPRQFKYVYVDGKKGETSAAAELGSNVHDIAENFIKNNKDLKTYDEILKSLIESEKYQEEYYEHCEHLAKFFYEMLVEKEYEFFCAEEYIVNDEYNFTGLADLVLKDKNGKLFVVDYKTGKSSTVSKYKLELCYYKMLIEGQYEGEIVGGSAIYFTKDGYLSALEFSENDDDLSKEELNSEEICTLEDYNRSLKFIDTVRIEIDAERFAPRRTYICKFCSFAEDCAKESGFKEA